METGSMKPPRDPRYLAFIRSLPCIVKTGHCFGRVEAAHTGPHGLGQKSSDYSAVPLCHEHHQSGRDSYHRMGPRKFEAHHNLNLARIAGALAAKPRLVIERGRFLAIVRDETYALAYVHESGALGRAIREALNIWHNQVRRAA